MTNKTVHRGMSSEKWQALKSVRVVPRYIWISCKIGKIPNPKALDDDGNWKDDFVGDKLIPYVEPGRTYNIGRNKAKRLARTLPKSKGMFNTLTPKEIHSDIANFVEHEMRATHEMAAD